MAGRAVTRSDLIILPSSCEALQLSAEDVCCLAAVCSFWTEVAREGQALGGSAKKLRPIANRLKTMRICKQQGHLHSDGSA